mgnify:CR=1 FL=1
MKTFIEKLKDFIYDSIDYVIIIAIIIGVVAVIGWRLDVLFAKDTLETTPPPIIVDDSDSHDRDDDLVDADSDLPAHVDEGETDEQSADNQDSEPDPAPATTVTITVPDGTLPSGIGTILESNGLVSSKNDFVMQAQSMGLDRRLRSGTFQIPSNSSLEEVIKIIAHQN